MKIGRIVNIALIFMLIGMVVCVEMAYPHPYLSLRVPIDVNRKRPKAIKDSLSEQNSTEGSEIKVIIEETPVTDKYVFTVAPHTVYIEVRRLWLPYISPKKEKTKLFYKVIERGGDKMAQVFFKDDDGNKVELKSFILHGRTWRVLKRFSKEKPVAFEIKRIASKGGIKPIVSNRHVTLEKNTKPVDLFWLCKKWGDSDVNETRLFTRVVEPKRGSKIAEVFCLVGDIGIILEKYKKKKHRWIPLESLGNVESRKILSEALSEIAMVHKSKGFTRTDYILDIIIEMRDYSDAMLMPLFTAKKDKIDHGSYEWFMQKGNLKRARFVVENLLEESSYDHLMKSVSIAKRFVDEFMYTLQWRKDEKKFLGNDEGLIEAVQDYYEFARTKHEELRKILTDLENIKRHSLTHLKKMLQSIIATQKEI